MYHCWPAHAFVTSIHVVQATKRHLYCKQLWLWKNILPTWGLLLLFTWRLQPLSFASRRYCALARFRQCPVEWFKVMMKMFSSFGQRTWKHSKNFLCGPSWVTHSWQTLMDNGESENHQSTQPKKLVEDVFHWIWEMGRFSQQKSSLLIWNLADIALLVQV